MHAVVPRQGQGARRQRRDKVLFLDARAIFRQIDRAHRDFTPEQIEFLANIVRLYRGESAGVRGGQQGRCWPSSFPSCATRTWPGLCKVATLEEIEAQGWSLNPGRYVGVGERAADEFDFAERLEELNEELEMLNAEAARLKSASHECRSFDWNARA